MTVSSRQAKEIDNIIETCRSADLEFNMDYYCVIIIRSSNINDITDSQVSGILSSVIPSANSQVILHRNMRFNSIVIIYGSSTNDESHSQQMAREIQKRLNEEYNSDIRIGIGNFYDSIFNISSSYEEALRVLEYNSILQSRELYPSMKSCRKAITVSTILCTPGKT